MCGIVGLLPRKKSLRASLGELMLPMLGCMADRGTDSAGLAVFGEGNGSSGRRINLYSPRRDHDWKALAKALGEAIGAKVTARSVENHAILLTAGDPEKAREWLAKNDPQIRVLSVGHSIDVYKDIGHPMEIAERYGFARLTGTHGVAHTRMATESAVTPAHSHPYTAGEDFCLIHNGSLSNPYSLRRKLEKRGVKFETDNDTEAACRFLEWRMREGDTLEGAIKEGLKVLDGFYTLLMATRDRMVLVRDAFACKPAVVAEHKDYVAVSSEYRALAHLPDVRNAKVFEPQPEEIYSWPV
jgi:methylamine---glutamate N-methyltransferase subunit A